MNLRRWHRAVSLAWAIFTTVLRFLAMRLKGPMTPLRRALWLQQCCRDVLRSLGFRYHAQGTPVRSGMVVSNHLSYLDIIVYSAVMPCVFVSKAEVAGWPYFGWAARAAGTIFLDRSNKSSATSVAMQMSMRISDSVPVLLFPEGTSTDGSKVLRFHSTLFEPAIAVQAGITAAAIRYTAKDGSPEEQLCWYGDTTLASHVWKLLGMPGFTAEVRFSTPRTFSDRRIAALTTHDEVATMRGNSPAISQEERSGVREQDCPRAISASIVPHSGRSLPL